MLFPITTNVDEAVSCVGLVFGQQISSKLFDERFFRRWFQKRARCNLANLALEQSFSLTAVRCACALSIDLAIPVVLNPPVGASLLLV